MKVLQYTDVNATHIETEQAKGIAARVVIGKADGAGNFCMRVFEIAPGGHTPMHAHDWEHEVFFHAGSGEILGDGRWQAVKAGSIAFVPGQEVHQIRNTGRESLIFACLVPSKAPEL